MRREIGAFRSLIRHLFHCRFARKIDAEEILAVGITIPHLRIGGAGDEQDGDGRNKTNQTHGFAS